jgi:electron transport complex protein RnfC
MNAVRGGLHLVPHKDLSTATSILPASIPKRLTHVASKLAQVLVKPGERVFLGQQLALDDSIVIHASVSGNVHDIILDSMLTITIDNDGRDEPHGSVHSIAQFSALTASALRERIAAAGITGLGGAAFPTAIKLQAAVQHTTQLLIVNGAECEPFITCDDLLMRERADDIVLGTQALLHATGAQEAVIAIELDQPLAIASIAKSLADSAISNIRVQTLPTFYPTGGERQLIKIIADKEVPSGKIPPQIGVLCQNVGTAAAIGRLIKAGQPLIERVVTMTGSGLKRPSTLLARFGTPIASLVADCGGYVGQVDRLIMGGPMMGVALDSDDIPVSAATNCIIAATAQDLRPRGTEMPCIRCGDCAHACPAGLLPQQLLRYARLQDRDALSELGLSDCIECGCCDYVCPSQIPLTAQFIAAKDAR